MLELPPPLRQVIDRFVQSGSVTSIGMGGSQATGEASEDSDVDIYVFTREPIPHGVRRALLESVADDPYRIDVGTPYWGDEDAFSIDGVWYELVFFDADWFLAEIDAVLIDHRARLGYSTSFMFTLDKMMPLHDPDGQIAAWKRRTGWYPEELATAIMMHNYPAVCSVHASLKNQIARALQLNDPVAVNHRVATFLACVFDIAFAHLRMWHPGEKRQLQYLRDRRNELPQDFDLHVHELLTAASPDRMTYQLIPAVDVLVDDVTQIVQEYF